MGFNSAFKGLSCEMMYKNKLNY